MKSLVGLLALLLGAGICASQGWDEQSIWETQRKHVVILDSLCEAIRNIYPIELLDEALLNGCHAGLIARDSAETAETGAVSNAKWMAESLLRTVCGTEAAVIAFPSFPNEMSTIYCPEMIIDNYPTPIPDEIGRAWLPSMAGRFDQAKDILSSFQVCRGLVLDCDNAGLLKEEEAALWISYLIDRPVTLTARQRIADTRHVQDTLICITPCDTLHYDLPLALLVNRTIEWPGQWIIWSLKENHRAVIAGEFVPPPAAILPITVDLPYQTKVSIPTATARLINGKPIKTIRPNLRLYCLTAPPYSVTYKECKPYETQREYQLVVWRLDRQIRRKAGSP